MSPFLSSIPELYRLPGFYEPFSAISHLVAAAIFLHLGWNLVQLGRGDRRRIILLSTYALSCAFLLAMSAVFHMMEKGGSARAVMERLDHAAIFVLIAGTFTAVHGLFFLGRARWIPIIIVWCVTATCITLKTVFFRDLPSGLWVSFYVVMGWGVAATAIPILRRHGLRFLWLLICGGIAYSIGALMEFRGWFVLIPGVVHAHEVWHIAVLTGVGCHWRFVWTVASRGVIPDPAD